jgi:phosphoserine phosphatase RsbU/P
LLPEVIYMKFFSSFNFCFSTKIILISIVGVLFSLLLSSSVALWNLLNFKTETSQKIENNLKEFSQDYLENHIDNVSLRLNQMLQQSFSELNTLANIMQFMIDHPEDRKTLSQATKDLSIIEDNYIYNPEQQWSQNKTNRTSVSSIWGYLHNSQGKILPQAKKIIDQTAIFDVFAPAMEQHGSDKLQMYYIGPKQAPYFRSTPYTDMAQTFDKLYPGHNKNNFWDFFFPGIMEGWQNWLDNPGSKPIANTDITITSPYIDALTGKKIISYFQPLWSKNRRHPEGIVGIDVTLEQIAKLINNIKLYETGFAFLMESNGNILAVNKGSATTLLSAYKYQDDMPGVIEVQRNFKQKMQKIINQPNKIHQYNLLKNGINTPYLFISKQLLPMNLWLQKTEFKEEKWLLGLAVPEKELLSILHITQHEIAETTQRFLWNSLWIFLLSLGFMSIIMLAITKRTTSGLKDLAQVAKQLKDKNYSARATIQSKDELGDLAQAFNMMAAEVQQHTGSLEEKVKERTKHLELANQAKSQFLANMSHEIRTPMNAIIGMSNLALEGKLQPREKNFISKVNHSALLLLGIINDILDFSKIEANKLELEDTYFHLHTVLDNFTNLIDVIASKKGLKFTLKTDSNTPLILKGDPLRLGQILINLGGCPKTST